MNKIYYPLLATTAFSLSTFCNAQQGRSTSAGVNGSVNLAIKAAQPTPPLTVAVRPITTGSAFMPGFVSQHLKVPTIGTIAKK